MTNTLERIARGEADASTARATITSFLDETHDFPKTYSILVRWTWVTMAERRADDDLRQWHRLILDIASKIKQMPDRESPSKMGSNQVCERLGALSDLVRISISMQDRPDKSHLLTRAHVPSVLRFLDGNCGGETAPRSSIQEALGLQTANLSRILTLLVLNGLVEREPTGRTARFRITADGKHQLTKYLTAKTRAPTESKAPPRLAAPTTQVEVKSHTGQAAAYVETIGIPRPRIPPNLKGNIEKNTQHQPVVCMLAGTSVKNKTAAIGRPAPVEKGLSLGSDPQKNDGGFHFQHVVSGTSDTATQPEYVPSIPIYRQHAKTA